MLKLKLMRFVISLKEMKYVRSQTNIIEGGRPN